MILVHDHDLERMGGIRAQVGSVSKHLVLHLATRSDYILLIIWNLSARLSDGSSWEVRYRYT